MWQVVHVAAHHAIWPLAILHGLLAGTDDLLALGISMAGALAVGSVALFRIFSRATPRPAARATASLQSPSTNPRVVGDPQPRHQSIDTHAVAAESAVTHFALLTSQLLKLVSLAVKVVVVGLVGTWLAVQSHAGSSALPECCLAHCRDHLRLAVDVVDVRCMLPCRRESDRSSHGIPLLTVVSRNSAGRCARMQPVWFYSAASRDVRVYCRAFRTRARLRRNAAAGTGTAGCAVRRIPLATEEPTATYTHLTSGCPCRTSHHAATQSTIPDLHVTGSRRHRARVTQTSPRACRVDGHVVSIPSVSVPPRRRVAKSTSTA